MDAIARGALIYLFLVVIMRLSGKRTMTQVTPFDLVLLLIISEATQQALLGEDFSLLNAIIVITTLIGLDIAFSLVKQRFPRLEAVIDGRPVIILHEGRPLRKRMDKERIDESDIMEAARELQGIENIEDIKYAVLERTGKISIVPKK